MELQAVKVCSRIMTTGAAAGRCRTYLVGQLVMNITNIIHTTVIGQAVTQVRTLGNMAGLAVSRYR